jgi:hypothetical protein
MDEIDPARSKRLVRGRIKRGDLSAKDEVHLIPRILDADINGKSLKKQPHHAGVGAVAGTPENSNRTTTRRSGRALRYARLRKPPQE